MFYKEKKKKKNNLLFQICSFKNKLNLKNK